MVPKSYLRGSNGLCALAIFHPIGAPRSPQRTIQSHLGLRSRRALDEPYPETRRRWMPDMAAAGIHGTLGVSFVPVGLLVARAYSSSFLVLLVGPYKDPHISGRAFELVHWGDYRISLIMDGICPPFKSNGA